MSEKGTFWLAITANRRMLRNAYAVIFTALLALTLASTYPVLAQSPAPNEHTGSDLADIKRIEDYLNDISTMTARFVQVDPAGNYSEGTMYIKRPGQMRFEFDPPADVLLLADGYWFVYVELDIDATTHIPLDDTPASVLLAEDVNLRGDFQVIALSKAGGLIVAEVVQAEDPGLGSIQLVFSDAPFALKQWTVTDAQGLQTRVTFTEAQFGMELERSLFKYQQKPQERN